MSNLLEIILLSLLPISELRGGIPLAIIYGFSPLNAFLICTLANIIVIPLIFIFLEYLNKLFLHIRWYNKFFTNTMEKARHKIHKQVEKYGYVGLMIFVAIPLPLTGVYTAALGSWALGMDKKKSFAYMALGAIIAGIVVTLIAYSGFRLFS